LSTRLLVGSRCVRLGTEGRHTGHSGATQRAGERDTPGRVSRGLAIRVARAPAADVARAVDPGRRSWALDAQPGDYACADGGGDPSDELALEETELGGPGGGAGADQQLPIAQRHRLGVLGDIGAYQLRPPGEHHTR